jgi:hypothetical protein
VDAPDELLACILDAAGCIKKREDHLRRKTRDFSTRVAKWTEVDGGILDHLLWTVTDWMGFLCNKFVIQPLINIKIKLTAPNSCYFIAIHNVSTFVYPNSSISVTVHSQTYVHTDFLFLITIGNITSQNIDLLDAAACIKKREEQLRRTTRDLITRVAKWTEVDGGTLDRLLWAVTDWLGLK